MNINEVTLEQIMFNLLSNLILSSFYDFNLKKIRKSKLLKVVKLNEEFDDDYKFEF